MGSNDTISGQWRRQRSNLWILALLFSKSHVLCYVPPTTFIRADRMNRIQTVLHSTDRINRMQTVLYSSIATNNNDVHIHDELAVVSVATTTSLSESEDVVAATSLSESEDIATEGKEKTPIATNNKQSSVFSPAAQWHQNRRREMLSKYGDQISTLERDSSSHTLALSLLLLSNISLFGLSLLSGKLNPYQIVLLALFPGSMFSLWTLQILHDLLHGSLLKKRRQKFLGIKKKDLQDLLLFWGSMPSAFGYYLYLKYGHLTHHKALGDEKSASLKQLFESDQESPRFFL